MVNAPVHNHAKPVNIKAIAADAKAKISGTGKHDIKDGENTIVVTITSESNAKTTLT